MENEHDLLKSDSGQTFTKILLQAGGGEPMLFDNLLSLSTADLLKATNSSNL